MKPLIPARRPLLALIGALAAALLAVPTARAQPPGFPEPAPQPQVVIPAAGTELFRALLDRKGIEPVTPDDPRFANPDANTIVVVIGVLPGGDWNEGLGRVRQAIAAGGAALIATDSSVNLYEHDNGPRNGNPVGWLTGDVTADWRNDEHTYQRKSTCPYVVPISPDELGAPPQKPGRVWSVFRGLTRVTTNQPTSFQPQRLGREYQYRLARFPDSARIDGERPNRPPLFAVGGDGPARFNAPGYSFLAMADSSVFINQMLMAPGTDNFKLTEQAIEYLQGPDKARKKCLFYENGIVVEKFDGLRESMRTPPAKIPPGAMPNLGPLFGKHQHKLVDFLDAKVGELEEKDVFHRSLVGTPGSPRERNTAAGYLERAAVLASIAGVLYLLLRLWRVRHTQDVPPAPSTGAGVASTGPPGVFDRRQKELVRRNNVYEPVRNMAREFFAAAGAPENPGPRMPELEITRAVRKPDSLRHAIRDMWRLAYGPPTPMTAQRWFELEPYFERIKQAHAEGKWRFL